MKLQMHSPIRPSLAAVSGLFLLGSTAVPAPLTRLSLQQVDEPQISSPSQPVPVVQVVGPEAGALPDPKPEGFRDANVQGPFRELPVTRVSDDVPPVFDDVVEPGATGDTLVGKADSNPYFLGFAAGAYFPEPSQRLDPELVQLASQPRANARPESVVYAFVMFEKRITPERIAELESMGLRNLGQHPHHTLKVALPVERLQEVASLAYVRWVGLARTWQKIHPALAEELASPAAPGTSEVWISVFESDLNPNSDSAAEVLYQEYDPSGLASTPKPASSNAGLRTRGWQERALLALGAQVFEYVENSRSFRVRIATTRVAELQAMDFVQFLAPVLTGHAAHDESMPLIHADSRRDTYDGTFADEAVVGIVDSGMTITHVGLSNKWAAGWDFTGEGLGAWIDGRAHGTHVTGTAVGRGIVEDSWAGAAPGIGTYGPTGRLFNYKIIDSNDNTTGVNWNTLYTYMHNGWTDGNGFFTPRPHVLNHSWGSGTTPGGYIGSEPEAVAFDEEVYDYGQLHVFAAHNNGPGASTVSVQGSAKNVLTVGGVVDFNGADGLPGAIWDDSSRGPTGDGRWKPSVVAPATSVYSIKPETANEYSNGTGTSMATPHVTGLAAQLMDHYSFLRYKPATTTAVLMATAMPKDNESISSPGDAHLDNYGAGRVEGSRCHGSTSQQELSFWGWPSATGASSFEVDVVVGPGATRLTAAFVYHEPAASVGAGQALVNDWDMWIDAAPFSGGSNTGEYSAHQSVVNNVELRSIDNPAANTYRIKLDPDSVLSTCRLGLAVSVIYGDTTPDGSLTLSASDGYVQPGDPIVFTASAFNPAYWASAVFFNSSSTIGDSLTASTATLKDGATANFLNNAHNGDDVLVGNIAHGQSRSVNWTTSWASEGTKTWSVSANSDNWVDKVADVQVVVDGTSPSLVSNLGSPSHTPSVWSNDASIDYTWTAATDALSGVDGYAIFTSNSPNGAPSANKDLGTVTSHTEVLTTDTLPYYFKIRTVDRSGNWTANYATTGGYLIDTVAPSAASNLISASHQVGVPACDLNVRMIWNAASDAHSGLAGYLAIWTHSPLSNPVGAPNVGPGATSYNQVLSEGDDWHFHLRTIDVAGNYGPTLHSGPYSIDQSQWFTYCTSKVSSNFCVPVMSASGAASLGNANGFVVAAAQLEDQKNGLMYFGTNGPNSAPFQDGFLCVLAPLYRLQVRNTGGAGVCQGTLSYTLADMQAHASGGSLVVAGAVLNLQTWFRDPSVPSATGLSNGLQVLVCP